MPEFEETLHRRLAYADRFMPLFIVIFAASIGGLIISTLAPDGYFEEVSLVLLGLNFIIFPFSNVHIFRFSVPTALPLRTVEIIGRILGGLVLVMAFFAISDRL